MSNVIGPLSAEDIQLLKVLRSAELYMKRNNGDHKFNCTLASDNDIREEILRKVG